MAETPNLKYEVTLTSTAVAQGVVAVVPAAGTLPDGPCKAILVGGNGGTVTGTPPANKAEITTSTLTPGIYQLAFDEITGTTATELFALY